MVYHEIISSFQDKKVLIIGDVMIDSYIHGHISRISPEAPVPVLNWAHREFRLGGAANVALNIKSLGGMPVIATVIGNDEAGDQLISLFEKEDLVTKILVPSETRMTTMKTRIMAQHQHLLRIDEEDTDYLNMHEEQDLWTSIEHFMNETAPDAIIFQDYNKGVLTERIIKNTILLANKLNIPTAVDPKEKNFLSYAGVSLFKPNLKEIRTASKLELKPEVEDLLKADKWLHEKLNHQSTMITLSENGLYFGDGHAGKIYPTDTINITDVCGAGDTVIAIVALCLAIGVNEEAMSKLANMAGGQVCQKSGVVPIDKAELLHEITEIFK